MGQPSAKGTRGNVRVPLGRHASQQRRTTTEPGRMQVQAIESMPFAENSYVLHLADRRDAMVIDPGLEPGLIVDFLEDRKLKLAAILCTHGHADHIGGNEALKEIW